MDFPQYTWSKETGGTKKDPINLVFSQTTLERIMDDLEQSGWYSRSGLLSFAWTQFTPDDPPRKPQNAQSFKGPFWERFHVRIWEYAEKSYVGAAHYEGISLSHGHDPLSFESGKHEIQDDLKDGSWQIDKDKYDLKNYTRKIFGTGTATEFIEIEP